MERGDDRTGPDRLAVGRQAELDAAARLRRLDVQVDETDRLLRRPAPARRRRWPRCRRRPRAALGPPPPSRPRSRPTRPRARRAPRPGRPAPPPSPRSRTRRSRRGRRRSSPGPRSAARRPGRRCRTPPSPASSPRARQRPSTSSSTGRSSRENRYRSSGSASACSSSAARSSAPGSTTRSTWISKSRAQIVASTPSPSPPASASAFATADSLAPKNRSTRRPGGCARASTRRTGSVSSARGHSRCSSDGGPGSRTTTARPVSSTSPGAVPASPSEIAPSGQRRLLADAELEVRVRPAQPLGDPARDGADLLVQALVEHEPAARQPSRRARRCGRRASGRARPRRGRGRPRAPRGAPPRARRGGRRRS